MLIGGRGVCERWGVQVSQGTLARQEVISKAKVREIKEFLANKVRGDLRQKRFRSRTKES